MDIKEKLEKQLKEVEGEFRELEQKRQGLLKEANEILSEQVRLQGEHRGLTKLIQEE